MTQNSMNERYYLQNLSRIDDPRILHENNYEKPEVKH